MSEWRDSSIAKVAKVKMGQSPDSNTVIEEGEGIPFLQGNAEFSKKYPVNRLIATVPLRRSTILDVLMSVRAPVGETNIADQIYCIGRGLCSIEFINIDKNYGWYLINQSKRQLKKFEQGSTFTAVSKNDVNNISFSFPSSPAEQRTIAAVLSTIDEAIESTEKIIAKRRRVKEGLLQDLFRFGLDEKGNLRSEKTHRFKDSPLGKIPEEWEVVPLIKCLAYISYGFTNPMPDTDEGPYLITAANIFMGKVQYSTCRHTSKYAYTKLLTGKSKPLIGDIVITKDGTLGRLAIVDQDNICINQSVAVLRVKSNINNIFLKLLLESPFYQDRIMADIGGSTIKHIYITKIDKMKIGLPKETLEQSRITFVLNAADESIEKEEEVLAKLQAQKRGIMDDLLTGKVRVTAEMMEEYK